MAITREQLDHLNVTYWQLAEAGDEYMEQSDALRDIYYFCQKLLDIEAGIEQGYLDGNGQPVVTNENRKATY